MKSRWITHRGKRIFIADYSGLGMDTGALQAELEAVAQALTQEPVGSVLSLSDFRDTRVSPDSLSMIKSALARTNPHVRKRAVVGFTGARKKLLEVIYAFTGRAGLMPMDDMQSAQDWLVSDRQ